MNTNEPNEFEHALAICQDKLEAAEREIEQIKNLNYSAITGLKSLCRHRPDALRQIAALPDDIVDVYYDRSMGVTPALFVRYRDGDGDGDVKLERVRLED